MIVYTAIFAAYDRPLRPAHASDCPHVLFTDTPTTAPGWDVRIVKRQHDNPARENRSYKLQPHKLFPGERTVYHDGGMRLTEHPQDLLDRFASAAGGDHAVFTLRHSLRHDLAAEFAWVKQKSIVHPGILDAQEAAYRALGVPFDAPTAEARLLISRPDAAAFYDAWWEHVRTYAHRDQLAFAAARYLTNADVHLVEEGDWRSIFTKRPHARPQLQGAT